MRPSENLSPYGGVPPLGVLWRGQGGSSKMPGRRQASLAISGLLHVENVYSPTTQAKHRASLGDRADYWDRLLINKLFNVSYFLDPQHLILEPIRIPIHRDSLSPVILHYALLKTWTIILRRNRRISPLES